MSKSTFVRTSKTDTIEDKTTITTKSTKNNDNIIWPEWVDSEVTAEKWEISYKPAGKPSKDTKTPTDSQDDSLYEDPYITKLPNVIFLNCDTWIKISSIYPDVVPVIYADTGYPDLVSLNRHLLISTFYRSFISSIYNLMYLGATHPFTVEWTTGTYNANTSSQPWKPWHHIYSMCKAGEGQHNPQVNSSGKYVVRLFWMGCWRKIIVDAFVPIDTSINILLPITKNKNKAVIELWPILLAKALLKLATLTCTATEDLVEFDIIQCLTGWVLQKIDIKELPMKEKWDIITGYTDHYVWTDSPPTAKKGKRAKDEKKKETKSKKKAKKVPRAFSSFHLVAACKDLMDVTEDIPDISPCPSHEFLIDMTRDIPLLQYPDPSTILPRWKEFRWAEWAAKQGIAEPFERPYNIKYCKLISNFRKITDLDKVPSKESEPIKQKAEKSDKTKGKKGKRGASADKSKDSKKKTKSSKGSSKGGRKTAAELPDPSFWTHFYNVSDHIEYLKVYLLPSQLESCTVISDLEIDKKGKLLKKDSNVNRIQWLNGLKISHNEPFYLFMDSIDHKYIAFNLSNVGNKMPKPNHRYKIKDIAQPVCEKEICQNEPCPEDCKCNEKPEFIPKVMMYEDTRTTGWIIIEEYNWKDNKLGKMPYFLNTYGSKSLTLLIEPGRTVWRLWLHSCTNLVLTVLSQTKVVIGSIEDILGPMGLEAELVLSQIYDICTAFGTVVKYFGAPEFREHLRNYYKVYLPEEKLTKTQLATMHHSFMNTLLQKLNKLIAPKDKTILTNALRTLFVDPTLKLSSETPTTPLTAEDTKDDSCPCEDINKEKLRQRAAVKIQSFFKMLYVRKLISKHNPQHPQFLNTFENLKNIYNLLFSPTQRINNGAIMVRKYVFCENMITLRKYLPYYHDLSNVLKVDKIEGNVSSHEENSWVVFTRFNFTVENDTLIKFCISSELPEYVLRVFDTDMNEEIKKYRYVPIVTNYRKNESGYAVLAYGWTRDVPAQRNPWSISLIRQQMYLSKDVTIENHHIQIQTIRDEYVPNLNNRIFRYIIRSDVPECLSFRLYLSSKNVQVTLNCLTNGNVLANTITGISSVVLPYVSLIIPNNKDSNVSTIDEASVLGRISINKKHAKKTRKKNSPKSTRRSKTSESTQTSLNVSKNYELTEMDGTEKSYDSNKFHSYYVLEAYVLDDTWPLTEEEWERVEERRRKEYLEKELENAKHLDVSSSKNVTEVLTPYYEITIIKNKQSTAYIEMDRQKIEYLKNFKMKCFNYNLENLLKAKKIRQNFIDSFKPNSVSYSMECNAEEFDILCEYNFEEFSSKESVDFVCPECNKLVPTTEPTYFSNPNSEVRHLPEFKLNTVYEFDYFRRILTDEDVKEYTEMLIEKNVIFGKKYDETKTKIQEHNSSLEATIQKLEAHYEEIENESKEIYEELDQKRSALISRLTEAETGRNPKKEGKKKGKKKKK